MKKAILIPLALLLAASIIATSFSMEGEKPTPPDVPTDWVLMEVVEVEPDLDNCDFEVSGIGSLKGPAKAAARIVACESANATGKVIQGTIVSVLGTPGAVLCAGIGYVASCISEGRTTITGAIADRLFGNVKKPEATVQFSEESQPTGSISNASEDDYQDYGEIEFELTPKNAASSPSKSEAVAAALLKKGVHEAAKGVGGQVQAQIIDRVPGAKYALPVVKVVAQVMAPGNNTISGAVADKLINGSKSDLTPKGVLLRLAEQAGNEGSEVHPLMPVASKVLGSVANALKSDEEGGTKASTVVKAIGAGLLDGAIAHKTAGDDVKKRNGSAEDEMGKE